MSSDETLRGALEEARTTIEVVSGKSRAFRNSFEHTLARIDDALKSKPPRNFVRCPTCNGEFDKGEWDASSDCPECETPKTLSRIAEPREDEMSEATVIDERTGRPFGDHGTASQAIDYAIKYMSDLDGPMEFLAAWREGDLSEWPEFYEWLAAPPEAT